jgi:hypothetical protein
MIATVPIHVYRRAIQRAEEILGDEQRLARYLRVPPRKLHAWRTGSEIPPVAVFLWCVDVIFDDDQLYLSTRVRAAGGRR